MSKSSLPSTKESSTTLSGKSSKSTSDKNAAFEQKATGAAKRALQKKRSLTGPLGARRTSSALMAMVSRKRAQSRALQVLDGNIAIYGENNNAVKKSSSTDWLDSVSENTYSSTTGDDKLASAAALEDSAYEADTDDPFTRRNLRANQSEPVFSKSINAPDADVEKKFQLFDVARNISVEVSGPSTHGIDMLKPNDTGSKALPRPEFLKVNNKDPPHINTGRYRAHDVDDEAFRIIAFTELENVGDTKDNDRSSGSNISLGLSNHSDINIRAQMRRATVVTKTLNSMDVDRKKSPDGHLSPANAGLESGDMVHSEDEEKEQGAVSLPQNPRPHGLASIVAMAASPNLTKGGGMWKKLASKKTFGIKSFANDEEHLKLLRDTNQKIATELPLPLKIEIHSQVFPIVCQMVKRYEQQLGKNHSLTQEAVSRKDALEQWGSMLADLQTLPK